MCQEYNGSLGKSRINKNVCLRLESGWNTSWFTSIGASYVYSNVNMHSPIVLVAYAAAEIDLRPQGNPAAFYAYKAGVEFGSLIFAYGLELRNSTDLTGKNHFIFTPKAGLSFFGHANLFYGYNVFKNANNVFGISHSQLSLNVNINRRIFKELLVPTPGQP